jgi:hypothetical protein
MYPKSLIDAAFNNAGGDLIDKAIFMILSNVEDLPLGKSYYHCFESKFWSIENIAIFASLRSDSKNLLTIERKNSSKLFKSNGVT